jgi:hypothetical protein
MLTALLTTHKPCCISVCMCGASMAGLSLHPSANMTAPPYVPLQLSVDPPWPLPQPVAPSEPLLIIVCSAESALNATPGKQQTGNMASEGDPGCPPRHPTPTTMQFPSSMQMDCRYQPPPAPRSSPTTRDTLNFDDSAVSSTPYSKQDLLGQDDGPWDDEYAAPASPWPVPPPDPLSIVTCPSVAASDGTPKDLAARVTISWISIGTTLARPGSPITHGRAVIPWTQDPVLMVMRIHC